MGIPSFYRWLLDRFPLSVVDAVDAPTLLHGGAESNPNGVEFDNLYLDMNGIIHPCFHPEGLPAPKTYDDVFQGVFKYIDRLVSIIRPRKLLYLAIDGVAPRAKMNQQRSRRFKAAKDATDEASQKEGLEDVFESNEKSTSLDQSSRLDSNVITPGTEFMALLSSALRYYIHLRMNQDPGWQGVKVILSDSSVPGEGEHKIMSYIRLQRNLPGYDPNTRHCLYGLDADLIMLALATHEIHFSILREDVQKAGSNNKSPKPGRHYSLQSQQIQDHRNLEMFISEQRFQFIHVWILREYLAYAMKLPDETVNGDLERLIDDFVFMCLFVGNDFLPHMPSLEISEGAIDLLMAIHKREFVRMGGYLTNSFEVNLERVKHFLQAVGYHECGILRKRVQREVERSRNQRRRCSKRSFEKTLVAEDLVNYRGTKIQASNSPGSIRADIEVDKIKYGEDGWKERYYAVKFDAKSEEDRERIRNDVVLKYTEGICWVMHYYYEGVCSWQWFYPYHYAPFASDFRDIEILEMQFTLGKPFKPFDQLMAVLPAASAHALPLCYRKLMTDTLSPLAPFYPADFELDMNGKRFSWQAICKLPFIEESLLLSEVARVEHALLDEERQRNSLGLDVLFIHLSHPLATEIVSLCGRIIDHPQLTMAKVKQEINPELSDGMNGYIFIPDKPLLSVKIDSPIDGMEMIANNKVLSLFYDFPPLHPHIARPPEGVQLPSKSISKKDIQPTPDLWHERSAVVGRLHSVGPIAHSIYGSRLAKSAHQLVLRWYLEKNKEVVQSLEYGEVAITDEVPGCENLKTVSPADAGGDGESLVSSTRKRKRKQKKKKISGGEHRDTEMVTNGPMSIASTVEKVSMGNTAGDEPASNLNLGDTVSVHDGGKRTIISTSKQKRNKTEIENNGSELHDTETVACSNLAEAILVGGTETNENTGDVGCIVSKSKKKRERKKARLASGMMSSVAMQAAVSTALISNVGDTASAVMDESTSQLQINQMGGDKNGIDGDSQKRIISNDHNDADALSCHLNLENTLSGKKGEITIAVVSRDPVKDNDKDNVVPDNIIRGGKLTRSNLGEATYVGGTDTAGNTAVGCVVTKSKKKRQRKKARLASGTVDNSVGMMSLAAMQTPMTRRLISNSGDMTSAVMDESTCQLQINHTGGNKNGIDGESGKCTIPNLNVEKTNLAGEAQGALAVDSKDAVKGNDEGNVLPDNNVREGEFAYSNLAEAVHFGTPETKGNTGDAGCVISKLERKREREKVRLASGTVHNDVGSVSSAAMQTPVTMALVSNLGDTTSAVMDESTCQSDVNQTGGHRNIIDGGSQKHTILNDHSGAVVLSCHLNLEKRIADEAQCEKTIAVDSKDPVNSNDGGNIVLDNNVREGKLMHLNSVETIHVGGNETNGNTGDAGCVVSKSKKKRLRKKARLASDIINNNGGTMSSAAMQTPMIPVGCGLTGADKSFPHS